MVTNLIFLEKAAIVINKELCTKNETVWKVKSKIRTWMIYRFFLNFCCCRNFILKSITLFSKQILSFNPKDNDTGLRIYFYNVKPWWKCYSKLFRQLEVKVSNFLNIFLACYLWIGEIFGKPSSYGYLSKNIILNLAYEICYIL